MPIRRLLPLVLVAAVACAQKREASGCRWDAQCASSSRCLSGVCTADMPPLAVVRPVGPVEAYALVQLDGSGSRDPDDGITEHLWSVRAVEASCAPPEIAGRTPQAQVRFGCPGRYQVSLAVRDGLGVASEPATAEVVVLPAAGAQVAVVTGPDLATDHVCSGDPLLCRTRDPVRLSAATAPGLALRWSVQPPAERSLDATRRVTFLPDPGSPTPTAQIVTDGTAISGDWIFRVEALDAYGVVGAAYTRVSIRNRAPVVTFDPAAPFPHAFDAARSVFTSSGALGWSVVDPDGDPMEIGGVWRHVGDGEGTFDGDFDGTTVTFSVEVPYAAPEDALRLRGGTDLSRAIEIHAQDVNREMGFGAGEIAIGNRPPIPAGGTFDSAVPHVFDRERSRYVAVLQAGSYVDPDGDPLVDAEGGVAPCRTVRMHGNDALLECSVPFEGVPALDQLAGLRTITVPVRDPWDVATVVQARTVTIQNSPPRLATTSAPATVGFWPHVRSGITVLGCPENMDISVFAISFDVTPQASDPDGDPIALTAVPAASGSASPQATVLTSADVVPFHFQDPAHTLWCSISWRPVSFLVASDGAAETKVGVSPRF